MIMKFQAFVAPLLLLTAQASIACDRSPTQEDLANATYSGIEDHPVTLTGGRWEGLPYVQGGASRPSVGLVQDFSLRGDVDNDGVNEYVVLLWKSSGGSGTFDYLAVMDMKGNEIRNLATAEIGDRVKIRSGRIEGGQIVLEVVQQGDGDAACCASQLATRSWSLAGGNLIEGEDIVNGALSIETLDGTEWVLTQLKQDELLKELAEVTMDFADGQVSGKSACNRYSASVEQGDTAGALKIGPVMGTRMACSGDLMELEQQYLEALSQVVGFSFQAGKLVLNRGGDVGWSALYFAPR